MLTKLGLSEVIRAGTVKRWTTLSQPVMVTIKMNSSQPKPLGNGCIFK